MDEEPKEAMEKLFKCDLPETKEEFDNFYELTINTSPSDSFPMGKEKQFPKGKGVPKVERDGFTMPHSNLGDMHIDHLGGHPLHPARIPQKAPKRFP
jgi:hypothetical protein